MQNLEEEIRNIVAEITEKNPQDITPESRFIEDLGIDSMMALEIMTAIEKKFKISIPEEKLMQFVNLKETVTVAQEYLNNKPQTNA